MKIIFITAQNMASANVMYPVLRDLHERIDCVIILNNFPLSSHKEIKAFFKLMRRCAFSFLVFKFIEVWIHYLISIVRSESISQLCRKYGVATHHFASPNHPELLVLLQKESPDYLISAGPAILRAPIIATAQRAVLNCHGARLPNYRGPANYVWTLANGDTSRWVTIHRLVEQLDAGPILKEAEFPIDPNWSVYAYNYYHSLDCGYVLTQTVSEILQGDTITEQPQDESRAVVRTFPTGSKMAEFKKRRISLWHLRDIWQCSGFPN